MRSYGTEYRNYYEGLKNKANGNGRATYTSFEQYLPSGSVKTSKKNINSIGANIVNSAVNTIILQMVGAILMFFFVFGAKYSENQKLDKYYDFLKSGVSKKFELKEVKADVEAFKVTDIIVDLKDSIKWIRDKMEQNPLNY